MNKIFEQALSEGENTKNMCVIYTCDISMS